MDIFRDPIWQFIGALISFFALMFTLILEWPTVKKRFVDKINLPKNLSRFISGVIIGSTSGLIGGLVFSLLYNEIGWYLDIVRNYEIYSIEDILLWGLGWGIAGLIFSLLDVKKSANFRDGLSGGILGSLLALPIGMLVGYFVSGIFWENARYAVTVEISSGLGASISMFLFGFIYSGFVKKIAKLFFKIWMKDDLN